MKTARLLLVFMVIMGFSVAIFAADVERTGAELFARNCAPCHPDGGNVLNKNKTLSRNDREMNNIRTADDIVKKMRNPGAFDFHPNKWSGMKVFDPEKLSDRDAKKIAEYIIQTFQ
jgi:cytochrome c6